MCGIIGVGTQKETYLIPEIGFQADDIGVGTTEHHIRHIEQESHEDDTEGHPLVLSVKLLFHWNTYIMSTSQSLLTLHLDC